MKRNHVELERTVSTMSSLVEHIKADKNCKAVIKNQPDIKGRNQLDWKKYYVDVYCDVDKYLRYINMVHIQKVK